MDLHFFRHATFLLNLKGGSYLIDPMLAPTQAMEPIQNSADPKRIPMVELPFCDDELNRILSRIAGVIVTHTHRDHWDRHAIDLLPKNTPILCQPEDEMRIRKDGFLAVTGMQSQLSWQGLSVCRTRGQHGTGEVGMKMGPVSGVFVSADGEPTIYVAGDTIWCREVSETLRVHKPEIIIVNTGAAAFLTGDPITMTAEDVACVCRSRPPARVVAVHMEAVNHCGLTRAELKRFLEHQNLVSQVSIPLEGDMLTF